MYNKYMCIKTVLRCYALRLKKLLCLLFELINIIRKKAKPKMRTLVLIFSICVFIL